MTTWVWVVEMSHYGTLVSVLGDNDEDLGRKVSPSSSSSPPGVDVRTSGKS